MKPLAWIVTALLVAPIGARACLNDIDSDTLANQAKGLPDVVRVITGRFERNPPLYYQMRVARVQKELAKNPAQLGLYDDIAVALDRLGRDPEAIAWMGKKKAQLDRLDAKNPARKEALYRYHANLGTFLAHNWLHEGVRADTTEMKRGRDHIAKAIQIKPNAHFGREKYQLMAMNWILQPHGTVEEKTGNVRYSFSTYMLSGMKPEQSYTFDDYMKYGMKPGADKTKYGRYDKRKVEGLSGLIVLGAAWESVDIFHALGDALSAYETKPVNGKTFVIMNAETLKELASLRSKELIEKGKRPLFVTDAAPSVEQWASGGKLYPKNREIIARIYKKLRSEADHWQAQRTAYMMARLTKGQHPDTTPTFWKDWKDTPPPSLETGEHWQTDKDEFREYQATSWQYKKRFLLSWGIILGGLILLPITWTVLQRRRVRRAL